jgi:hypothetical protein
MATNDINNVRMGPCSIIYNSVNLGHTKGGVTLTFERSMEDLTVDKYGAMPIDKVISGGTLQIEVQLAEPQVDQLRYAVPEGDYISGSQGKRIGIGRDSGYSLRANSGFQLTMHPIDRAITDTTEDVVIYKAVSTAPLELPYRIDEQRVFSVTFNALVDESFSTGRRLGHIGLTNVS